ncbi:MAG: hypothetical protein ACRDWN_05205 [Acidimicrobiales bacterium]
MGETTGEAERRLTEEPAEKERTALDLLEDEDHRILELAAELEASRGQSVESRADYGNFAKLLVRHFAAREAAVVDVVEGLAGIEEVDDVRRRLLDGDGERRQQMNEVERMSRGIQGMYLNTGRDFDGELEDLMELLRPQISWELAEGIVAVRHRLGQERCRALFHSARHVARHAPTHVSPGGPRWYERAPVISRLLAAVQHLRDFPRATPDART